ncbi:FIST signal transduction protein [Pectinatus sottacetonis]|uniref:FIST signal transduction protein n=1 Tax=Pectinatus sottacetonis TaxID=1002795 RepID=UPI0018C7B5A8|nr:FIST N-terminal domain-containing protein [Pectinatus sottacetonis]
MKTEQLLYDRTAARSDSTDCKLTDKAQFVMVFGSKNLLLNNDIYNKIRYIYPKSYIIGATTAGEIHDDTATENTVSATAVYMEKTPVKFAAVTIENNNYIKAAAKLIDKFPVKGLKHILVISEGININGSKLIDGLNKIMPPNVTVSGGLAGDGKHYKSTFVIANEQPAQNRLAAVGFYGNNIHLSCASIGGWAPFGIERTITKAHDNVLYEFDEKSALDLYKEYLGEYADELPAAGLYFPLMVRSAKDNHTFIRTIQRVNEQQKTLIFSGDVPQGYYAKLMRTNLDDLIHGSQQAAKISLSSLDVNKADLAILISCVGRKLVLDQMTGEEIEAARDILGLDTTFAGFYSYGEISSSAKNKLCELHNQTMTITLITEV